jgi:hypothetical protein
MNSIVALPIVAAIPVAAPAMTLPPAGDDAELVALADQVLALHRQQKKAEAVSLKLYAKYEASAPERPEVLRRRIGDPAGPLEETDAASPLRWCHPFWVEKLRGVEQRRYWFVGTDEEAATIKGTEFDWMGRPDASIAHLYRSEADPQLQRRADELLAAQDAFDAADRAAMAVVGYEAASDKLSAITDEMWEVCDRMADLEASTFEGFRSLAIGFVCNYWCGKIESSRYGDEMMLAKIMSSLTGLPLSA